MYTHFKQRTDWTCGPAALSFLLHIHGIDVDQEDLLIADLETGTSPEAIISWLFHHNIRHAKHSALDALPMLVNYTPWENNPEEDGHYAVILQKCITYVGEERTITYYSFDPSTGGISSFNEDDFLKHWYSHRYGATWGLTVSTSEAQLLHRILTYVISDHPQLQQQN